MTDMPSLPDTTDEVAQAVRNLMPGLRRQARIALGLIALAIGAAVAVAAQFLNSGMESEDRWKMAMLAVFVGGMLVVVAYKWTIRAQESLVMPVLARSIGLSYSKNAKQFIQTIPKRLLPARGIRGGEDFVQGTLGAHAIQMAEVYVETGGKRSRTLFKGIVAQFPNRVTMPAFFVASEDQTRPGVFFGGDLSTEGLHHLRNVSGGAGRTYGVWTSWTKQEEPKPLSAVVDILTRVENHIGQGAELYAATSNGVEMHIALTHRRDLFHVGGLFPNEANLFSDVRAAVQDLMVPLTLAKTLIEAEEIAAAKA
jgi:hypothetical protein